MSANCFIFTALHCEAKPFIAHFKLKKDSSPHPFAIYRNETVVLTISGSGKVAMAAAVAYTMAVFSGAKKPVLLNAGIAGHRTAELGTVFGANKITDADTGRNFYPQPIVGCDCETLPALTVSTVENDYRDDGLYEMEASAFYETACRFTTAELIQVFKTVSDNHRESVEHIDAKKVTQWLEGSVKSIAKGIENLRELVKEQVVFPEEHYETLLAHHHFSVSSRHQLKALLQRLHVLSGDKMPDLTAMEFANGKALLKWLEIQVEALPFRL